MALFVISFTVDMDQDDGEDDEALLAYVRKTTASDWLPEGFVFDVTPVQYNQGKVMVSV